MIEASLVELVQGTAAVSDIAASGGFFIQLPKGTALPSWTYFIVSEIPEYTLESPVQLTFNRVQIDCYGEKAADAILLAKAIDRVLTGFRGTATGTYIHGCFRSNKIDFFDDAGRTYRRLLEYEVWFDQAD